MILHRPGLSASTDSDSPGRSLVARLRELMPHRLQPESISRFERMAGVGSGCMGEVYRAYDTALQAEVALKVANRHERGRISIENEIRALSRVRHSNIVRLLDSGIFSDGPHGGRPFLVMEFIEGDSLQNILKRTGTLERDHAKHMLMELCDALSASHEAGFIHRDIKPENILIGREGLCLVDFGVSEPLLPRFSLRNLTMTRFMPGNIEFAAPEIFMGKSDQRTDIYSTGMLMRLMRAGSLPGDPALLFGGAMSAPGGVIVTDAGLTEAELRIIARATDKSPENRYESAAEMRAAIQRV